MIRTTLLLLSAMTLSFAVHAEEAKPVARNYVTAAPAPDAQTQAEADAKSAGCVSCHTATDNHTMHASRAVVLGCTDCHGGNASINLPAGSHTTVRTAVGYAADTHHGEHEQAHSESAAHAEGEAPAADGGYLGAMEQAHVLPRYPANWNYPQSRNPEGSFANLNKEAPEFVRFINPGDLRIAREACGSCHLDIIEAAERSMMSTSVMLWGGASYNNGILPYKRYNLGESYTRESEPNAVTALIPVTPEMQKRGVLPILYPLPAWETIPPADVFRVFERGGRNVNSSFPETGLPNSLGQIQRLEEPGRPDLKQSNRGPGTGQRVAIPALNIHKTRLNDPHLWFLGTNDNPGDFRSSGCTSCHVVYANDRDPRHSAGYAQFGNLGMSQQIDPTIPKNEPGHPLKHEFTRAIPTSQCMSCHMHQPNMFINTMLGYTMWDYETAAPQMWPKEQKYPTDSEIHKINRHNPEEAAIRGNWGDRNFMKDVALLNADIKDTQFADYHGHGWNFRAVFKRDRKGTLLDAEGAPVADDDPDKFKKAVHLSSIHVDLGMQCVDCHFAQDAHGNGHIVGEVMAGVEIQCQDCHGTSNAYPTLSTSGPAASTKGKQLALLRNPDGKKRFEWMDGALIQRSVGTPGLEWKLSLLKDVADSISPAYNAKATRAHTMSRNTSTLEFGAGIANDQLAHGEDTMTCYTCHTSWTTSCGGCHLPIQANWKTDRNHYEGGETRNFATYNPQVARDDVFQLGIHGEIKDYKYAPVRSSSALVLSSTNSSRERIYIQQPPVSASGFSSQAFAPHYPHTERRGETKTCTDCHLSKANDNNAIMAQLLLQGTKFADFLGFSAWVGGEGELSGVIVTEWDEPQSVIGSYLQRYAYPDRFKKHVDAERELAEGYAHRSGVASCLQHRGEYLYVAEGGRGTRIYDIASIANKGFAQRIVSGTASEAGQDTHIESRNATCVVLPTTQPIHPARNQGDLMRVTNQEQAFASIYNYAYITDAEEGLILVDVNTLSDGDPRNNHLERALTWNENGVLNGVRHLAIAGNTFYASTPEGVVVLDMSEALKPRYLAKLALDDPRAVQVQLRYAFVTTAKGLQVIDVTRNDAPRVIESAVIPIAQAYKLHVARTFAYVAAGKEGIVIVDVTNPELPRLYQRFNAEGALNDTRDITVASTNASLFAYVADGKNGLRVLQLTSPESQPKFYGYSPDPKPELIASYRTRKPALSLSRALERDRAVDETGGQIAVLGRLGSRPMNAKEMQHLYLDKEGNPWFVEDKVEGARGIATPALPHKPNHIAPQL
ncbi:MAG: hypothetical protein SGI99_09085 [Pseudomonadota bacterium]|nr:hypothetical protein [Pseudomonadota bacterium]